jgi:uncharacterized repeat protein (TIGR01451 family)
MKRNPIKLLTAAILLAGGQQAFAATTAASTPVLNTATISYTVNTVPQTAVSNDPAASFVVDRKVNVVVTSDGNEDVVPKATAQMLTFTVTNTTNDTMDFDLGVLDGSGDDFDPSSVSYVVDNPNGLPAEIGVYDAGDVATYIDELPQDASRKVFVFGDIPDLSATAPIIANGSTGELVLTATAHDGGTAASLGALTANDDAIADTASTVQNVFADDTPLIAGATDALLNGDFSAAAHYTIASASINVAKTSFVLWDPINLYDKPKAIPDAVVVYCISVSNTGTQAATDVSVSDPIPAETAYVDESIRVGTASVSCDAATVYDRSAPYDPLTLTYKPAAGTLATDDDGDTDGGDSGPAADDTTVRTAVTTLAATTGVATTIFQVKVK